MFEQCNTLQAWINLREMSRLLLAKCAYILRNPVGKRHDIHATIGGPRDASTLKDCNASMWVCSHHPQLAAVRSNGAVRCR